MQGAKPFKLFNLLLSRSIYGLFFLLAFCVLIFPNSFQLLTAVLLVGINFLIFIETKENIIKPYFIFCWGILSSIFIFFIAMSDLKFQFKIELFLKYVFFPILWINIFSYLKQNVEIDKITRVLFVFLFLSFLSVIILYFLMLNGYNYVEYFFKDPNIDADYHIGFTLHVYGNQIFFAAGVFILPQITKSKLIEFLMIFLFVVVAFISARTALIAALAGGMGLYYLNYLLSKRYRTPLLYLIIFVVAFFIFDSFTRANLNYSFFDYLKNGSIDEVMNLGGVERTSQTSLMVDKIIENPWGIGFGNIGIERNADRDFKYEVLILVTVLQYGIIPFTLIVLTLVPVFKNFFFFTKIDNYRKFYLAGFVSIITFSFTNPYLESFCFQWMFFAPLVFLIDFSDEKVRWNKTVEKHL